MGVMWWLQLSPVYSSTQLLGSAAAPGRGTEAAECVRACVRACACVCVCVCVCPHAAG